MWGHPSFRGMFGSFPDLLGSGIAQSAVSPRRKNLAPCAGTANCVCKSQTTGLHALASTISRRTMISSGSDVCEIQTIAQTNVLCSSTKGQGRNNRGWSLVLAVGICASMRFQVGIPSCCSSSCGSRCSQICGSHGVSLKPGVSFIGISPVLVCVLCARARARMDSHSSSRALRFASAVCDKAAHRGFFMPHCGRYTTKGRELLPLRVSMVANIAQITAHRCPVLHQCQCCHVGSSARVREWGRAGPRRVRFISHTQ